MTIPSARELAEIGHTYANGYSYEGEWGIRKKSRSDKAAMENFIQESRETRAEFVAAAVRDAVIEAMVQEAVRLEASVDLYPGEKDERGMVVCKSMDLADWLRSQIDAA